MLIFRGALQGITNSQTIAPLSPELKSVGQAYVLPSIGIILGIIAVVIMAFVLMRQRSSRVKYGFEVNPFPITIAQMVAYAVLILGFVFLMNQYRGIPVPFILVIFLAIIFTFISKNTVFGRQVYAIGGNPEAASLSGSILSVASCWFSFYVIRLLLLQV